jgi:hypothetical protein
MRKYSCFLQDYYSACGKNASAAPETINKQRQNKSVDREKDIQHATNNQIQAYSYYSDHGSDNLDSYFFPTAAKNSSKQFSKREIG